MPTEDAYSSGHLVLSHFGTCKCSIVETNISWTCLVSGLLSFEHPSVLLFLLYTFTGKYLTWQVQIRKMWYSVLMYLVWSTTWHKQFCSTLQLRQARKCKNGFCRIKLPCVVSRSRLRQVINFKETFAITNWFCNCRCFSKLDYFALFLKDLHKNLI